MSDQVDNCPKNIQEASSREELLLELSNCLKHARELQELSIEEIALSLKLRTVYLRALESGNWDDMPGEVYAIGFLKQYAGYLNIDVSESVELLKTGQYKLTRPVTFPDSPLAPSKTWVIVAALAFIVLFILFNLFDDSDSDNVSSQSETVEMAPSSVSPMPDEAVLAPEIEAKTSTTKRPAEKLKPISKPASKAAEERDSDIPGIHLYRLTAVDADVWLQLYSPDESPLLLHEALLKSGESMKFDHDSPVLLLTCGNPRALQVEIDEKLINAAGTLGKVDKVLRDFRLTAPTEPEPAP